MNHFISKIIKPSKNDASSNGQAKCTALQVGENCDSWVFANTEGLSVKQENMPSGTKEKLHFHYQAQQFFYILKGTATFYIDGEMIIVSENKGLQVHPKSKHFISNETQEELEFLVISQPSTNNDRNIVDENNNG